MATQILESQPLADRSDFAEELATLQLADAILRSAAAEDWDRARRVIPIMTAARMVMGTLDRLRKVLDEFIAESRAKADG